MQIFSFIIKEKSFFHCNFFSRSFLSCKSILFKIHYVQNDYSTWWERRENKLITSNNNSEWYILCYGYGYSYTAIRAQLPPIHCCMEMYNLALLKDKVLELLLSYSIILFSEPATPRVAGHKLTQFTLEATY